MALSAAGHFFVTAVLIALTWPRSQKPAPLPFEVFEAPVQAPLEIREAPKPKPEAKPRAVFGIQRNAHVAADSPVEAKAGNTVAKAPDLDKLKPEDADALPVPTEEYLVTQMPQLIGDFRVPYPAQAKQKGVQGAVTLDLLIDRLGTVREALVVGGPGEGLNEAALEAAKKLRFKPAYVEDQPVAVRIRYAYRFVLE